MFYFSLVACVRDSRYKKTIVKITMMLVHFHPNTKRIANNKRYYMMVAMTRCPDHNEFAYFFKKCDALFAIRFAVARRFSVYLFFRF